MSRTKLKSPSSKKKKISETLIQFASPMLDLVGTDAPPDTIRELFMTAVTVWNGVVWEQLGRGSHYVNDIRQRLHTADMPPMAAIVDELIERKRTRFSDTLVMISSHEIVYNSDQTEFIVRAEGRVPKDAIN
jgi:hypothetical protein